MIIVNQNNTEFVNFENIMSICITNCDEDGFGVFAACIVGVDDIYRELGIYETEERAQEIFKEIIEAYKGKTIIQIKSQIPQKELFETNEVHKEKNIVFLDETAEVKQQKNNVYYMPKE